MPTLAELAIFSSAAYDERRLIADGAQVAGLDTFMDDLGSWDLLREEVASDEASFTDESGMQADVWIRHTEVVTAFRGIEIAVASVMRESRPRRV